MTPPAEAPARLVEVVAEDPRWEEGALEALAERAARATLEHLGLPAEGFEIALLAASDARVAALNADFRGKPTPTNVLSWPVRELGPPEAPARPQPGPPDDPEPLGDIALAWETCMQEAAAAGRPSEAHLTHLIVHATLHLLGYDHECDRQATVMEALEVAILAQLGLSDPYEEAAGERLA